MEKTKTPAQCYVRPHATVSREVTADDIKRVVKDGQLMFALCSAPVGHYRSAFAIAHSQVTDEDPLRFFITREQRAIINPVIVRHTSAPTYDEEGCMTYYYSQPIQKGRWYRCEVQYQTIDEKGKLTEPKLWQVKGLEARMIQHEIDHMNGIYLYPIDVWQKSLISKSRPGSEKSNELENSTAK